MNEEKFKDYAKKMVHKLRKLGVVPAELVIEDHLKQVYAQALEDAGLSIRNIYQSRGFAPGDWPTPEQCADLVEQKAKEVRGEE